MARFRVSGIAHAGNGSATRHGGPRRTPLCIRCRKGSRNDCHHHGNVRRVAIVERRARFTRLLIGRSVLRHRRTRNCCGTRNRYASRRRHVRDPRGTRLSVVIGRVVRGICRQRPQGSRRYAHRRQVVKDFQRPNGQERVNRANEGRYNGNGARVIVSTRLRTANASTRTNGDTSENGRGHRPIAARRFARASTNGTNASNGGM